MRDRGASEAPKEKSKITYDKYMSILNALVRRVNDDAQATEDGVEEEELLVWYLEQREAELETQEDLDNEKMLAKKVLARMVKVCGSEDRSLCRNQKLIITSRTTFSCRYVVRVLQTSRARDCPRTRLFTLCIPIAPSRKCNFGNATLMK